MERKKRDFGKWVRQPDILSFRPVPSVPSGTICHDNWLLLHNLPVVRICNINCCSARLTVTRLSVYCNNYKNCGRSSRVGSRYISRLQTNYSNYNQQYSETSIYPAQFTATSTLPEFSKKNQFGPNESNFLSYKHVTLCNYVMRFELVFPASIKRQFWGKE